MPSILLGNMPASSCNKDDQNFSKLWILPLYTICVIVLAALFLNFMIPDPSILNMGLGFSFGKDARLLISSKSLILSLISLIMQIKKPVFKLELITGEIDMFTPTESPFFLIIYVTKSLVLFILFISLNSLIRSIPF